ncbi:MAG: DUF4493 domain-containing protein [Muribaculaceae bacterium]|nr:DUF4493 domain-containing protein [Muribaculaceae bacterium]
MKLFNKVYLCLATSSILLGASCSNETPWSGSSQADGKINLNVWADGQVNMSTRADDVASLVPNEAEFSITLKSTDGSYNNTWKNLNAFKGENGFPMGNYIISATFGDIKEEGFKNPYYYGETPVNVIKGEESSVVITAALANSMFSVRYTDDFKKFFPGYSATVTTEGHEPVVFVQSESRPAYITPGLDAIVKLTLTNPANETVTVSPTKFKAEPRKHYIVTFGVDGNINLGDASLKIEWSEELVSQDKPISLTDELFTTAAPTVTLEGYSNTEPLFEGLEYEGINPEFHIVALGGLTHATLTLAAEEGNGVVPTGFSSIDLVNADANNQSILNSCGIVCNGLYDKVDKFAVVNFKEYLKGLTPGTYTAKIDVEDKFSRTLETPVEFKVVITGLEYNFLTYEKPDFLANEINVVVETNCKVLKDQLMFKVWDTKEDFVNPVSAEFVTAVSPEGFSDTKEFVYTYKLVLPEAIDNYLWKVQTQVPNKNAHEMDVNVNMPEFTVDVDAFAKKVKFRINPDQESVSKYGQDLFNNFKLYKGSQLISSGYSYDASTSIITLTEGITPDTNYSDFVISFGRKVNPTDDSKISAFQSEKDTGVPNGDFETLKEVYAETINQGGTWATSSGDFGSNYQNTATFKISEAENWSTSNNKTMGGNNKNTWFYIPSVFNTNLEYTGRCPGVGLGTGSKSGTPSSYSDFEPHSGENAMVIRNVAWDPSGTTPTRDTTGGTSGFIKVKGTDSYYNYNVPTIANKSAGKMFLGTYPMSEKFEEAQGYPFASRPLKLKGWYKYSKDSSNQEDNGKISIIVYDNDTPIASGEKELSETVGMLDFEIDLDSYAFQSKATRIAIMITSSKYASSSQEFENQNIAVTTYLSKIESYMHGATLIIDDLSFEY